QLRQPVGGSHVAGGQRGERGGVELLDLSRRGNLLTVLVDQEDGLGVGLLAQTAQGLLEMPELLLVKHEVGCAHGHPFRTARRYNIAHRAVKALIPRQLSLPERRAQRNSRQPWRTSLSASTSSCPSSRNRSGIGEHPWPLAFVSARRKALSHLLHTIHSPSCRNPR